MKRPRFKRRTIALLVLAAIGLIASACSCGDLVGDIAKGSQPTETPTVVPATRRPSATPPPPSPTATRTPTLLVPAKPTARPIESIQIPTEPNKDFTIEATQEEINDYLAGKAFEQQGLEVREVVVTLTGREISGELEATYTEMNLSAGATVRGVPSVADGQVFFKINDIELDDSISGIARIVAKVAIEEAIDQYSTPQGIPIPKDENIEVLDIQLLPGKLIIKARTR